MRKFSLIAVLVALCALMVFSPTMAQDEPGTIVDVAASTEGFSTLVAAIEAAGLVDVLSNETALYTVFAPTDEAFAAALEALGLTAEELLADTDLLTTVLAYHVIPGQFAAEDIVALAGSHMEMMEDATSVRFATLASGTTLDVSFTEEGGVTVDAANVIATDVFASNGVIHVIDAVILPGEEELAMLGAVAEAMEGEEAEEVESMGTLVDVAVATEGFGTLVAAVQAAGLDTLLAEGGPYTVFAPTDDAFAAALETLEISAEDLLADTDTLTAVLAYHVVPWIYSATDVVLLDGAYIGTLLPGQAVYVSVDADAGTVAINDVNVSAVDVQADNGVIHVIDGVLLPTIEEESM